MFPSNLVRLVRQVNFKAAQCASSSFVRTKSTAAPKDLVLIDVNDKTGIATMTMNSLPVNSLNLELLSALSNSLDILEKDKVKGMILTSASKTVFSAGIDINEMYKPDPKRIRDFWRNLQDVWIKLYGSTFPTAAAINGHAPAGGCFLAISCEYRVMCPKYTIGLNETQLGIVAPWWFMATMRNCISSRDAEMALTLGTLFKTDQALRIGMVDEMAADKAEALAKCEKFLLQYKEIPSEARTATKMAIRGKDIQRLKDTRGPDTELFASFITEKKIQKSLGFFVMILRVRRVFKSLTKPFGSIAKMFGGKPKIKKNKKYSSASWIDSDEVSTKLEIRAITIGDVENLELSFLYERSFQFIFIFEIVKSS